MAPIVFDEVNVFTFPHSRMRKLMNCCTSKVGHTDFTSLNDFEGLLIRLQRTFTEFMAHEEIENIFVMKKLKKKLKENCTMKDKEVICNCHKEDRFTPLMSLFRDGYAFIRRGNADRMSYGIKLHKAMIHFYQDFVPHMHEEENDIQPLLSKYFTEMELKIMRIEVIKMTLQKRENSVNNIVYQIERPLKIYVISYERLISINNLSNDILENIMKYLTDKELKQSCFSVNKQWNRSASKVVEQRSPISKIPNEILMRLFTYYLNPLDLLNSCIRVNKQWRNIIQDQTIWKIVNPINWAKGQWDSNIPLEQTIIDEDLNFQFKINENRVLTGFIKYFLPNFGSSIKNLILYGSLTINDNTARKIFDLCPNLKHVNVGMTKLTSKSFLHFRWINSLESLILEGCELMDDNLFTYLINSSLNFSEKTIEDKEECLLETVSFESNHIQRFSTCQKCFHLDSKSSKKFQLKIVNFSGCYRLTDDGLNLLILSGLTENVNYIDLSGCTKLTSDCISLLLSSSKYLINDNLYICDNIQSSSFLSTANCCRNIENNSGHFCCRRRN